MAGLLDSEQRAADGDEYQAHACHCGACGCVPRAAFPASVTISLQFEPQVAATAVALEPSAGDDS